LDVTADGMPVRLIQQIALEVENRDEFLRALAHRRSKGVEPIRGPLGHGLEGGGTNPGGSGSRSCYFLDPDGNRLEIFTDAMQVPNGEQFPRAESAEAVKAYVRS
jgi:catechol 2,3-dioxygenase-like lactoylglutathione lyase family enzyme